MNVCVRPCLVQHAVSTVTYYGLRFFLSVSYPACVRGAEPDAPVGSTGDKSGVRWVGLRD